MSMAGILAAVRMVIALVLVVAVMCLMLGLAAADRILTVDDAATN